MAESNDWADIDQPDAKEIVALLKGSKLKVEDQINGVKLQVCMQRKDDPQDAIALLGKVEAPSTLHFEIFKY